MGINQGEPGHQKIVCRKLGWLGRATLVLAFGWPSLDWGVPEFNS